MKTNKSVNIHLPVILLFLSAASLHAQVPAQYRASYNQMMRKEALNDAARMHNRTMLLYRNPDARLNPKYTFTVLFKDSSTKTFSSRIHLDEVKKKYYLLLTDKDRSRSDIDTQRKIYADQTISISRVVSIDNSSVQGIATDSCWFFKVLSGEINAYSEYSDIVGMDAKNIAAIQTGTGPIECLVPERLEKLVSVDEKAYRAFKRKHYYTAIERFNKRKDKQVTKR